MDIAQQKNMWHVNTKSIAVGSDMRLASDSRPVDTKRSPHSFSVRFCEKEEQIVLKSCLFSIINNKVE